MDNNLKGNPSAINYGSGFNKPALPNKKFIALNVAKSNKRAPVKKGKKKTASKIGLKQRANYG